MTRHFIKIFIAIFFLNFIGAQLHFAHTPHYIDYFDGEIKHLHTNEGCGHHHHEHHHEEETAEESDQNSYAESEELYEEHSLCLVFDWFKNDSGLRKSIDTLIVSIQHTFIFHFFNNQKTFSSEVLTFAPKNSPPVLTAS